MSSEPFRPQERSLTRCFPPVRRRATWAQPEARGQRAIPLDRWEGFRSIEIVGARGGTTDSTPRRVAFKRKAIA